MRFSIHPSSLSLHHNDNESSESNESLHLSNPLSPVIKAASASHRLFRWKHNKSPVSNSDTNSSSNVSTSLKLRANPEIKNKSLSTSPSIDSLKLNDDHHDNHISNDTGNTYENDNGIHRHNTQHSLKSISYSGEEDDNEDDEDEDAEVKPLTKSVISNNNIPISNFNKNDLRDRRLSREDASSIIGGVHISRRGSSSTTNTSDHSDTDDDASATSTPESTRKVFNFTFPFSGKPESERTSDTENTVTSPSKTLSSYASSLDQLKTLSNHRPSSPTEKDDKEMLSSSMRRLSSLSTVGTSLLHSKTLKKFGRMLDIEDEREEAEREEIRNKLEKMDTLSTLEEELYYKDITKLEDGKMKALRRAILPSLSLNNTEPHVKVFDQLSGDVLIMGGYRGSILRDTKTGRRAWIPVLKAGLNIRKINLMIGPKDEDEKSVTNTIYPDGMLTHIGPVDISKKLIKKLESNPKVKVHNWGYDWRLSLDSTCEQLYSKLKDIYENNGNKPILIIGHSMGGIVAHGTMVKDPKLVRGIIYAGTPLPCVNILGPLRYNDTILLCNDLLTADVNFMMRSSFVFLPPKDVCLFKDIKTGEHYHIDFFDPKNWVEYNLNALVSSTRLKQERGEFVPEHLRIKHKLDISFDDAYDYLTRTLDRTAKFLDTLRLKDGVEYPPMALIYSNGLPSVKYSLVDGLDDIKEGDYYHFFYGPGDGVTHQNYLFPSIYNYKLCGKFLSHVGHIGLVSDVDCVGKAILSILQEEEKRSTNKDAYD